MLKQASLMRDLKGDTVQCRVCEHFCVLDPGDWGKCGVRVNQDGALYLAVYGNAVAAHVDPIEKKPLFHFLPGTEALSIGTYGCNMKCQWCQNWELSQTRRVPPGEQKETDLTPERIVDIARNRDLASIAYTYNEPTVFFEYTYDTAKLAHEYGIKNVYVSNGFMSEEVIETIAPYLDAINVDLKGFTNELYEEYADARLDPVKRNIEKMAEDPGIWVEVTTLIIPDLNDSDEELREAAAWLTSVDPDIPWHLSAFHPSFEMRDRGRTPKSTLDRAYDIGKEAGLHYIYVGNVMDAERGTTRCPECGTRLVERLGFTARSQWETPGTCHQCRQEIAGFWA